MSSRAVVLCLASGFVAVAVSCVQADPPEGYYDAVTGTTGPVIKSQLTTLTNSAITRSYDEARNILQVTDEDPANPDNIILVYTGDSILSNWTSGATWNREHCWPRSLGVGTSGADNSDLHMLRPCNPSVNSSRGNKAFGTAANQWDPDRFGQQFRGEMARMAFYATTRYTYLNMALIGSQPQLVDWHFEQMPDADDARRNDSVYIYQRNRNPYVDRPEWVWAVYGDGPSDAQIIFAGATHTDGASSVSIDLGAFIDDGSPLEAAVQLDKAGAAPTTYLVSASGDVSSDAASGLQAGFGRGARSAMIPVSLGGGAGLRQGTLTIDTTELTSAGAGQGSADGDDTAVITAFALDPAIASLDEAGSVLSASIDLGSITVGGTSGPVSVPVWNLADDLFGAALDIDGVTITGLADGVSLIGAPILGVPAGASAELTLEVAPTIVGPIAATATVLVSDEDVPGASSRELEISIVATAVTDCPADTNGDGVISPADLNAWIFAFNTNAPECDQNGDGLCTPADYNAWVANYNTGCP